MRVFVSLIVWLFSVTGTDGELFVKPSHMIAIKRSRVTFKCGSDNEILSWSEFKSSAQIMNRTVKGKCVNEDKRNFDVRYSFDSSHDPPLYSCDLTVKATAQAYSYGISMTYMCEDWVDITDPENKAQAILLYLESPLKCEEREKVLSCTLWHSAYRNTSEMFQYLEIKLEMKNPTGMVVASKFAGFMDNATVITMPLDGGKSFPTTNPYICAASFTRHCDDIDEGPRESLCVEKITIQSPNALECKYSDSNWAITTKAKTTTTEKAIVTVKATETSTVTKTTTTEKAIVTVKAPETSTVMKTAATERAIVTVKATETSPAMTFEAIETVPAKKLFAKNRAMGTIIPIVTTTSSEDINAEDPQGGLLAAKAVERRTTTTRFRVSNARLERDGVDSFVMLTSLLVAFLVQ